MESQVEREELGMETESDQRRRSKARTVLWTVTETKERENFRERSSTLSERFIEMNLKKSLLFHLTNNQEIQMKTIRYHCLPARWLGFSRLMVSRVGKDRGKG